MNGTRLWLAVTGATVFALASTAKTVQWLRQLPPAQSSCSRLGLTERGYSMLAGSTCESANPDRFCRGFHFDGFSLDEVGRQLCWIKLPNGTIARVPIGTVPEWELEVLDARRDRQAT
jgi:hypothetical protein